LGKILPIILALVGLGTGVGAGIALRPTQAEPPVAAAETCEGECPQHTETSADHSGEEGQPTDGSDSDFVKMNNQFVVPVVRDEKVTALVVMSLNLELVVGGSEVFYQREPKLRDAFLQVLFDHANSGGFDGVFTEGRKMDSLRAALFEMARKVMGDSVKDVLVTDILRQDT